MDTFVIITMLWGIACLIGLFGIVYCMGKIKGFEEFRDLYEQKVREHNEGTKEERQNN